MVRVGTSSKRNPFILYAGRIVNLTLRKRIIYTVSTHLHMYILRGIALLEYLAFLWEGENIRVVMMSDALFCAFCMGQVEICICQ